MNFLVAKIRERGNRPKYWKLLSGNEDIYAVDPDMSHIPYNPATLLEEDMWFSIDSFSSKSFCLPFLREPVNTTSYPKFRLRDFEKLDFLFSYQNDNIFCFQNITKSQLVRKRALSVLSGEWSYSDDSKSITIHVVPDAIYLKDVDRLYFRKLSGITSIFEGISELYREATEEETQEFLNHSMIHLADGFTVRSVKTANRKRIALAMNILGNYGDAEMGELYSYIRQYCNDLEAFEDRAFVIGSENQLRSLLYGIEQRYYTTPIGQEKRLANSVVPLENYSA